MKVKFFKFYIYLSEIEEIYCFLEELVFLAYPLLSLIITITKYIQQAYVKHVIIDMRNEVQYFLLFISLYLL